MDNSETIRLESGKIFELPFTPVEPTGKGVGRVWVGVTDDDWKALFDVLRDYSTVDRTEVCKVYRRSYPGLHAKYGGSAKSSKKSSKAKSTISQIDRIKSQIVQQDAKTEKLKLRLISLKDAGISELQAKIDELKAA